MYRYGTLKNVHVTWKVAAGIVHAVCPNVCVDKVKGRGNKGLAPTTCLGIFDYEGRRDFRQAVKSQLGLGDGLRNVRNSPRRDEAGEGVDCAVFGHCISSLKAHK